MVSSREGVDHQYLEINGVRLHVALAGPAEGELIVLLHGFPEYWEAWAPQLAALASAGYRVAAPDQRGYNLSGKPARLRDYAVHELARDVSDLITALGREQAIVVGHDWGGVVAWWTAMLYPAKVSKLGILNIPHPKVMKRNLRENRKQMLRSWYIFAFQIPRLPELAMRALNFRSLVSVLVGSSRKGTFSEQELANYRAAWSQPLALRGMVNWYRALFQVKPKNLPKSPLEMPVRILWGGRDAFLLESMAEESLRYCKRATLVRLPQATHWLHHEEPARISEELLALARTH